VQETSAEYLRKGNFVRIYPAPNSDMYDQFFAAPRPYNYIVYKALYSDELFQTTIPRVKNPDLQNLVSADKSKTGQRIGSETLLEESKKHAHRR